jgi:hypothetical protein
MWLWLPIGFRVLNVFILCSSGIVVSTADDSLRAKIPLLIQDSDLPYTEAHVSFGPSRIDNAVGQSDFFAVNEIN